MHSFSETGKTPRESFLVNLSRCWRSSCLALFFSWRAVLIFPGRHGCGASLTFLGEDVFLTKKERFFFFFPPLRPRRKKNLKSLSFSKLTTYVSRVTEFSARLRLALRLPPRPVGTSPESRATRRRRVRAPELRWASCHHLLRSGGPRRRLEDRSLRVTH